MADAAANLAPVLRGTPLALPLSSPNLLPRASLPGDALSPLLCPLVIRRIPLRPATDYGRHHHHHQCHFGEPHCGGWLLRGASIRHLTRGATATQRTGTVCAEATGRFFPATAPARPWASIYSASPLAAVAGGCAWPPLRAPLSHRPLRPAVATTAAAAAAAAASKGCPATSGGEGEDEGEDGSPQFLPDGSPVPNKDKRETRPQPSQERYGETSLESPPRAATATATASASASATATLVSSIQSAMQRAVTGARLMQEQLFHTEYSSGNAWLDDDDVTILHKEVTPYNFIQVVQVARRSDNPLAGARLLLLDNPGNIHSIYYPYKMWTDSYYDRFAALPPLIPNGGPIAILGLAAGTAARVIQHTWADVDMYAWEIDPAVVQVARQFFDLSELENPARGPPVGPFGTPLPVERAECLNVVPSRSRRGRKQVQQGDEQEGPQSQRRGRLHVIVGDALEASADVLNSSRCGSTSGSSSSTSSSNNSTIKSGNARDDVGDADDSDGARFAGVIVDLFGEGAVLAALSEPATWRRLRERLLPVDGGGVVMVNCGGGCVEGARPDLDGEAVMWQTVAALRQATPAEEDVMCRRLDGEGGNVMVLAGGRGGRDRLQCWLDYRLPCQVVDSIDDWLSYEEFVADCPAKYHKLLQPE